MCARGRQRTKGEGGGRDEGDEGDEMDKVLYDGLDMPGVLIRVDKSHGSFRSDSMEAAVQRSQDAEDAHLSYNSTF